MAKQDIKKANTIKLFGKNIIVRGEIDESNIVLSEEAKKTARIKDLKVFLIGDEVEKLEVGDEIRVDGGTMLMASQGKQVNPFQYNGSDYKTEDEFYILLKEEEIIGKF